MRNANQLAVAIPTMLLTAIALARAGSCAFAAPKWLGWYNNHTYYLTGLMDYNQASAAAVSLGQEKGATAYLVTIDSPDEEDVIRRFCGAGGTAWTGLYFTKSGLSWTPHLQQGITPAYYHFCPGEPNHMDWTGIAPPCGQEDVTIMNWCPGGGWNDGCRYITAGSSGFPGIIEVEAKLDPCPYLSINALSPGELGSPLGHLGLTLCTASGAKYNFALYPANNPLFGLAGLSFTTSYYTREDGLAYHSRALFPLTSEQFTTAFTIYAQLSFYEPSVFNEPYSILAPPNYPFVGRTNCTRFALEFPQMLGINVAQYGLTAGYYDPAAFAHSLDVLGNGACIGGTGYVDLNTPPPVLGSLGPPGSVNYTWSCTHPWDFAGAGFVNQIHLDPSPVAACFGLSSEENVLPARVCGPGQLISLQLIGPGRNDAFRSVRWSTGLGYQDTTSYSKSATTQLGADESFDLVVLSNGAIRHFVFPTTVVPGAGPLALSVRIPVDSTIVSNNGPFTPLDVSEVDPTPRRPEQKARHLLITGLRRMEGTNSFTISYQATHGDPVQLWVYDVAGRKIEDLSSKCESSDRRGIVIWDADQGLSRKRAAGIYFIVARSAGRQEAERVVVVR